MYYWNDGAAEYKPQGDWSKEREIYGSYDEPIKNPIISLDSDEFDDDEDIIEESLQDQCKRAGIGYSGYLHRRQYLNMTHEEALASPGKKGWELKNPRTAKQLVDIVSEYNLPKGTGYLKVCKKFGKNPCTVRKRINRGWSLKDALTMPLNRGANGKIGAVVWDDNYERLTNGN